jgi:chromosome segregation ATPase
LQEARRSLKAAEQKVQQMDAALTEAQADNERQQHALEQQREAQQQAAATSAANDERQHALEADLQQLRDENTRLAGALEEAAKTQQAGDTARQELAELAQRLEERELALKAARNEQAELIEALNAASAERETLQLSLSDQDSDQARLVDLENQLATLQHDQQAELLRHERQQQLLEEQLEQANALRSALEEEVARLTELIEDDANTDDGDVRAERDALQAELALRESEVEQLRGVLEEYVDQIRAAQTGGGDASEAEALRAELEMVREQAVRDVAHMREQLAAAERQQRRLQEADGREAVSHESMRQRIEELEGVVAERQRDLARAESARHMLEDELEDANTTVDTLRREAEHLREDADQAMLARREAENAREQLQKALEEHHAHVSEARDQDLRDDRLHATNKPIGMDSVAGGGRLVPALLGAGLVIAALEAATFATGNGEFFTLMLSMLGQ